jgi:5,6-dimethylbenzimidazole synthase
MTKHAYSAQAKEAVYRVIAERRDVRHFTSQPIDTEVLTRIISVANQAPSVGLMQPWRIIRITDEKIRQDITGLVEQERQATAEQLNERQQEFLKLKVSGMDQCSDVLVMALMDKREKHIFGRRTLPEMDLASVACAIQNMWLAARAEGIGLGWVSIFDPEALAKLLNIPEGGKPVAILCLGHVDEFYTAPMLQLQGWKEPESVESFIFENTWQGI